VLRLGRPFSVIQRVRLDVRCEMKRRGRERSASAWPPITFLKQVSIDRVISTRNLRGGFTERLKAIVGRALPLIMRAISGSGTLVSRKRASASQALVDRGAGSETPTRP